ARNYRKLVKAYRILGSSLAAIVVVFLLMTIGLRIYGLFDEPEEDGLVVHPVSLLDDFQRQALAGELGEDRPPPMPVAADRLDLPGIDTDIGRHGFVELEVLVGVDGSVGTVRVIDSYPQGVYEEQAIREVRQRRLEPPPPGTDTVTRVEIVEFSVPDDGS
ncbi:MAG: TonB family protein, partial [Gammaproteobacteria bacterium]|nr:TonB family protein [Gammaproteobacteria bacterium]